MSLGITTKMEATTLFSGENRFLSCANKSSMKGMASAPLVVVSSAICRDVVPLPL